MSAESSRAVFLSYASQDAEAARRIADALRAAGVEVWFDQSELRGGDAWDQEIRRQIKECALFVPITSASTQARHEGYFRLEWKLAADRSHLIAHDHPFLMPIVVDATPNDAARVPEEFQAVQWTRLPAGETSPAFCQRVRSLLDGGGGARAAALHRERWPADDLRQETAPRRRPGRGPLLAGALASLAIVVALTFWQPWRGQGAASSRAAPSEARQLAESARKHFQGIFTRADLAIAEEFGRRASEKEPTLALAWAVRAGANACYLMRGFVNGEAAQQRARDAQSFANQAIALNRDETEALIALGQVAMFQNAPSQAEAYYRRVLAREPDNPFAHRYLSIVLRRSMAGVRDAIALMQDAARKFPRDTLTHYDLALAYAYGWDWRRAWEEADAALAIEPFPGALMLKVRLAFQWKGDVALMRELIETLDVTYRGEDDAVVWDMRCALWARQPDRVLEAAGRTAREYLEESFIFPGPKAWFTAKAHEMAGRSGLARQHWQRAESVVRERLNSDPQNLELRLKRAVILAALGDGKAQQELDAIESAWRDQMNPDRAWDLASYYGATGDAVKAVALLRTALHAGPGIAPLTLHHLKLDPWWDRIRGSPEFQALLDNPPPLPAPIEVVRDDPRFLRRLKELGLVAAYRESRSHVAPDQRQTPR
jgi:tetratricopeptide (TPR) repeat protein